MTTLTELLNRNARFAETDHQPLPMAPAANTVVVISCLDSRTDPAHFLGLQPGEVLVLRNAGGRITPDVEVEIGLLAAMTKQMAGPEATLEVVLIHHTDCGMQRLANPQVRTRIGAVAGIPTEALDRLAIHDHTASLTDDLARLRRSEVVPPGIAITGLRYDQQNGKLDTVFAEKT